MRLRSLELQGFKSFPDKTRLTFDSGITAVVGPNGSGKSNISDAVRWVLGEQSTKTLRGNRMEDVIFGGTHTRKPLGFAHVELTIDNSDGALPEKESLLTISRRLYRSGESEYRINNTLVRLRDIHELFMDTGLGRDGYSIIGQGRIAEIVSAKSHQRREIFEEAAGIAKFRYRKEEAEKRLAQAEENLLRLRDILVELEDRVGPLKIQAEKAKAYLELSGEKKQLEISLWLLSLEDLRQQLSKQEDKIYICKNQYEKFEKESEAIEQKIAVLYARSQELSIQAERKRTQIREMEEKLSKSEADLAVLRNDIHHNELSVERVEKEIHSADTGAQAISQQIEQKEQKLEQSKQTLEWLQGRIQAAQDRVGAQREQAARVGEEIERLNLQLNSVNESISEAKQTHAADESLLEESEGRVQTLGKSSAEMDLAVQELQNNIAECGRQINEQNETVDSLINMAQGYALKRESHAKKLEELLQRVQEYQTEAQKHTQRVKLLEDMEAGMEGFAGSVKYVLKQSNKGALGGIFGAVSSLISTDARYITAIETALGAAMQNIVVRDESVAKSAIRMLQSAGAGRATFLPLTSVKGGQRLRESDWREQDGFIGSGASLVQCEERFSGIIDQLLGRVAVVEDLESGSRLAKANGYRFRVVTLDGQVIHAGGSFTGGSTARSTGVLGRRNEIEKLHKKIKELEEKALGLEPKVQALREKMGAMDAYLTGVQSEEKTAREELVRLSYARESLIKQFEQAKENRRLALQELETLEKRLHDLRNSTMTAQQLMQELEAEKEALQTKITAARSRRDTLAVGAETASAALSEQRMTQLAAQKDHDLLVQEITRLREQAQGAGTRAQALIAERDGYLQANKEIVARIEQLGEEMVQLRAKIEEQNKGIEEIAALRTQLEGEITAQRTQERELSGQRESVSRELARLEERRIALQRDYDTIISKLWDEYDLTRTQAQEIAIVLPDREKASRRLSELRTKIKAIGTVNVDAVEEYKQVSERYEFLRAQVEDVEDSKEQLTKLIVDLTKEMREIFTENFSKIAHHFSKIFVDLFGGGKAELTLTQPDDVLESGVDIFVEPPGKIIKNLSLLSGGEQAFVAIAIYFAILKVRPAPFCLLDEIEAALDDVNVFKFASYLRTMSKKIQFIAITHRRGTMEEADVLYGVTMQDEGVSKLLELNISEVESKLGM